MKNLFGDSIIGKIANAKIDNDSTDVSSTNKVSELVKSDKELEAMRYLNSKIIPRELNTVQDIMLILDYSEKTGMPISAVANNLVVYDGRVGWKSTFIIGLINNCKKFNEDLRFTEVGKRDSDEWGFFASIVDKKGDSLTSQAITIKMAKEEGWYSKEGSKWKTMPEQLMMYRAAAFFSRLYIPDVVCGLLSQEELYDVSQVVDNDFIQKTSTEEKKEEKINATPLNQYTNVTKVNDEVVKEGTVVVQNTKDTNTNNEQKTNIKKKEKYYFSKDLLEICELIGDFGFKQSDVTPHKGKYFIKIEAFRDDADYQCLSDLKYFNYCEKKKIWYRDISNDLKWY